LIPETRWTSFYTIQAIRAVDYGDYYSYLGQFTGSMQQLSPVERQVVQLCRRIEISSLYKSYGGKKFRTERDFILRAEDELLERIRAFTAKIISQILRFIQDGELPLYLKKLHLDNPHKKDRVCFHVTPLRAVTGFYRTEENIRYRLTLFNGEKEIIPSATDLQIVTLYPGTVLLDTDLFYLPPGFSAVRLKPFLTKRDIIIPHQNEREYFRKFILKNIGNDNIETEGFDVVERKAIKQPILSLEKDIAGYPIAELCFRYNTRTIPFASDKPAVVELEEVEDQYRFYTTRREPEWEKRFHHWLLSHGLVQWETDFYKVPDENTWATLIGWIRTYQDVLQKEGFEIEQDKLPVSYYTGGWQLDYTENSSPDWFRLHAQIILEDGTVIPFQNLWQHILSGNREYIYGDNKVFIIPEEWFSRYSAIMLFGKKEKGELQLQRNQFSLLEEERGKTLQNEAIEGIDPPYRLHATLREYQLSGYRWLYQLYRNQLGACLADDMGLGKTIQTIGLLLKYKEENKPETGEEPHEPFATCLIVAPASVVHNWRNELRKFAPSLLVAEYTGPSRVGMRPSLMRWEVIITTYQTLRNDIDFLKEKQFGVVVFDESQSFKNRDSQVYQAVSLIQGNHFIALSGTPIENSLSDLWSLMSVINPGLLGNHTTFYNYFVRPITSDVNGLHSDALRRLIQPFILRRTKEEVLKDLPERTDELIICDTDPEQQQLYDEELSKARNRILESKLLQTRSRTETFGSLQAIIRLRQIANHPRLANPDYSHSSGKFREIFRMLEEIDSTHHKVLLFSDYVSYLDLVAEEMKRRTWEYAMLTGSTGNREEVIRHFSQRPECRFFLISLKAGGVGLNLTEADYVFILDPWWNLAAEEQAISRAHRIGQKQAIFVYRFVTAGTLEEKILNIQRQKQDISDAIIPLEGKQFHPTETELERLLTE
ncbi:MAG: DEAD/DEAH box helicase, partial [Tannerellaceae bacterium]|nr:DEAD/DEAH box helicase [Tannerellaceae bacterium]